jgi:predicted dehydrogenase
MIPAPDNRASRTFGEVLRRFVHTSAQRLLARARTPIVEPAQVQRATPVLRCGVIGLGVMGLKHCEALRRHGRVSLAGITSRQTQKRAQAEAYGCRWFESPEQMLGSGEVDAVVIATPHWQHPSLTIAALRAGLHVICEKPLTVTVEQADAVLRAAQASRSLLTVVCQSRFHPAYSFVKSLLAGGELGPIMRCEMTENCWRPSAYYRSASWRGTWQGEGGGVLVNQAPHVVDRYLWLCGMPRQVGGFCDTALHPIEVEDTVSVSLRHKGGMHGYVHVSTAEFPWLSRLLITCDRGLVTVDNGCVRVIRLRGSLRQHTAEASLGSPELAGEAHEYVSAPVDDPSLLARSYENFALAVAGFQPLMVTAAEAVQAVEVANAALMSSATGEAISLPIDRAACAALFERQISRTKSSS